MPSSPFLVSPPVELAYWLPVTLKDFGIARLFNNLISFNTRLLLFFSYAKTFFLLLCHFEHFSRFFCVFYS